MFPLQVLKNGENTEMMIELKNGEVYNGTLSKTDPFMNVKLENVICTSQDGEHFFKMKECFIRGNNIKYMRISETILEKSQREFTKQQIGRGDRGGRMRINSYRGRRIGRRG